MPVIVGVDEAGRGPLAGPVAVGLVAILPALSRNFFRGIKDSKKLSPKERELWFALAQEACKKNLLKFTVSLVSEKIIDKRGINQAISLGIKRGLKNLGVSGDSQIFLDGGIRAPEEFLHQTTVVRGDEKIPVISLASIVAKVTRDKRMTGLSKKYPKYNFHKHKGYGTFEHRKLVHKHGLSPIHRRSFTKHLKVKSQ